MYLTSKIPKSQNSLAISYNNNLNTLLRPVFQNLKDFTPAKGQQPYNYAPNVAESCILMQENKELYFSFKLM